jgi:hypothetical protein
MTERYDRSMIRADLLRQKLENVVYEGVLKMMDYCTAFRTIEQQLFDMSFEDRLHAFLKPLPPGANMHIRLMNLAAKDMDTVYMAARQWAHVWETTRSQHRLGRSRAPVAHFIKDWTDKSDELESNGNGNRDGDEKTVSKTISAADVDLDMINKMEYRTGKCYTCRKEGHFMRDCSRNRDRGYHGRPRHRGGYCGGGRQHFYSMGVDEEVEACIETMTKKGFDVTLSFGDPPDDEWQEDKDVYGYYKNDYRRRRRRPQVKFDDEPPSRSKSPNPMDYWDCPD